MHARENLHRAFFAALFITLAAGSDLFAIPAGPLSLYPLRIVIAFSAAYYLFLNVRERTIQKPGLQSALLVLPLSMILYGSIMLLISDYINAGLKELGNLIFALGFIYSVTQAAKRILGFWSFLKELVYWPLGFILTLSLFEIATKSHLPSPFATEILITDPIHFVRLSPAATFGNPNHLAIFLIISFFILYAALLEKKNILKPLLFITLILIVLWFTLSRFGLMAVTLPLLYLPFHFSQEFQQSAKTHKKQWLGILFLFAGVVLMVSLNGGFTGGMFAAEGEGPEVPLDLTAKSSRTVRMNMLKNGWELFQESRFLGVGPGQFSEIMKTEIQPYDTFGYSDAHSGFVEIISQYGLFILLIWAAWGLYIFIRILKKLKRSDPVIISCFFMTLAFIPMSSANSSFLSSPLIWAFLSMLNLLVFHTEQEEGKQHAN